MCVSESPSPCLFFCFVFLCVMCAAAVGPQQVAATAAGIAAGGSGGGAGGGPDEVASPTLAAAVSALKAADREAREAEERRAAEAEQAAEAAARAREEALREEARKAPVYAVPFALRLVTMSPAKFETLKVKKEGGKGHSALVKGKRLFLVFSFGQRKIQFSSVPYRHHYLLIPRSHSHSHSYLLLLALFLALNRFTPPPSGRTEPFTPAGEADGGHRRAARFGPRARCHRRRGGARKGD